jgi:hypothetical protein
VNSVNECLNAMLEADRALHQKCLDTPDYARAFNRLADLAGQRDEVIAAASRWLLLQDHAERTTEVLRTLLAKYGGPNGG